MTVDRMGENMTAAKARTTLDLAPLDETLDFLRVIWSTDHALHRASGRMMRNIGVTGPQRLLLRVVGRYPAIPPGQAARALDLHPSTVTGLVQRLESGGYLRRTVDPRDARRVMLSLTEAGRALDRQSSGTIEQAIRQLLAATPRNQIATTASVLRSLRSILAQAASGEG